MEPGGQVDGSSDGSVTLRSHRHSDIDDIVAMCRDAEMVRWTTVPDPYTVLDAEAFLAQNRENRRHGTPVTWAIEVAGRYAGNIELRLDGARGAEIGYALAPWSRSQGLLSRSLRLALPRAFATLQLDMVRWRAAVGNWPSRRVAWACGFSFEGRQRGLLPARGAVGGEPPLDAWIGSLRRGEELSPAYPWLTPPIIRAGEVLLRPHAGTDVPRIAEACADDSSQWFLPTLPSPYSRDDARAYLEAVAEEHAIGQGLCWAVTEGDGERLLASIGLRGLGPPSSGGVLPPTAEVGYWAHPDARGRGVTTAALRVVVRHALLPAEDGGLGLRAVQLRAAADNAASRRVADKAGFRLGGRLRDEERRRDGSTVDRLFFDLTAAELT